MIKKIQRYTPKNASLSDVTRIQKICELHGYKADLEDCDSIWQNHSESMIVPKTSDSLWLIIGDEVKLRANKKTVDGYLYCPYCECNKENHDISCSSSSINIHNICIDCGTDVEWHTYEEAK